jgi:hypothetical protein
MNKKIKELGELKTLLANTAFDLILLYLYIWD